MAETSPDYEVAKRCPRCDTPGDHTSSTPGKDRRGKPVSIHMIFCRNEACSWFNTSWIIQVNQDGSIPPPTTHKRGDVEKLFPTLGMPGDEQRVIDAISKQVERETQPGGGEVRNPRSR